MTSDAGAGIELTPRAKETLDALSAEFQAEIMARAKRRSAGNEVGVRDVLEAFEDMNAPGRRPAQVRISRLTTLLSAYAAIAAILSVVSVVALFGDSLSPAFSTALLTGSATLVGASVAFLFSAKSRADRAVQEQEMARAADRGANALLERWIEIETGLRSLAADAMGSSVAELPLGELMAALEHAKVLAPATRSQIKHILQQRNAVAHDVRLEKDVLTESIADADTVLATIASSRGRSRF